jgi:hypothetical protein
LKNWSWEKVERRLRSHIAKAERQLQRLENYSKSAYGAQLGVKPGTPCELVEDETERRKRIRKLLGKRPFKGAVVLHACDNPQCVFHVHYGTQSDNMRDCYLKGRHPRGTSDVDSRIARLKARLFLWKLQLETKTVLG